MPLAFAACVIEPLFATARSKPKRSLPPRAWSPAAIHTAPCNSSRRLALRRRGIMLSPQRDHDWSVWKAYPLLLAAVAARRAEVGHAQLGAEAQEKVVLPLQVARVSFGQRAEVSIHQRTHFRPPAGTEVLPQV